MTESEALRIAKAIDEIIREAKNMNDIKNDLTWLKDNVLGSVTKIDNKGK